ncbi:MAG: carboxymuconolactone decarboxylase family protein [Methanobacteriaceae archaeon]
MNNQDDTNREDRFEKGMGVLKKTNKVAIEGIFDELNEVAPDLARFIVEFPYSEIYTRETLDLKTRELITIGALTVLGHALPQLEDHVNAALNVGATKDEIIETIMQMTAYGGFPAAINGMMTAKKVFDNRDRTD